MKIGNSTVQYKSLVNENENGKWKMDQYDNPTVARSSEIYAKSPG